MGIIFLKVWVLLFLSNLVQILTKFSCDVALGGVHLDSQHNLCCHTSSRCRFATGVIYRAASKHVCPYMLIFLPDFFIDNACGTLIIKLEWF